MELKEAIERLKNTDIYNLGHNDRFEELRLYENAIDTVLEELNNRNKRIHKLEKNIEFIINKIVNKAKTYQYHTKITAGTNTETNIGQQILTELLEEIKKEI